MAKQLLIHKMFIKVTDDGRTIARAHPLNTGLWAVKTQGRPTRVTSESNARNAMLSAAMALALT